MLTSEIDKVVPFDRIAFANYFYRPAKYKGNIGSVGITSEDEHVADEIMRWIVRAYEPRMVLVASATTAGPRARAVLCDIGVRHCVIHHPMSRGRKFRDQAVQCLSNIADIGPRVRESL